MSLSTPLHLFQGYGIELEYMIVDADTLDVKPVADELLRALTGGYGDFENGAAAWSNELVLHVIEFKTNGPAPTLTALPALFESQVHLANRTLASMNAKLMPGAMHPWMDPMSETKLWPHDYSAVYEAYNRIFDCRGHGWSNLQSMHINLPFAGDDEFGRLHAAIRLVLPLLSAIAASSPVRDGRLTGLRDSRLEVYRFNSARIPSMTGSVVPEPVFDKASYEREILGRIYAELEPHDPECVLREEFANARGAIARFDRDAIEIRTVDVQECPLADIAVASLTCCLVRALVEERWASYEQQKTWPVERLAPMFIAGIGAAEQQRLGDMEYLRVFGYDKGRAITSGELWRHLLGELDFGTPELTRAATLIAEKGCLASRIVKALRPAPTRERMAEVYSELCNCIAANRLFDA